MTVCTSVARQKVYGQHFLISLDAANFFAATFVYVCFMNTSLRHQTMDSVDHTHVGMLFLTVSVYARLCVYSFACI